MQPSSSVRIWQETVVIPTYAVGAPDKNPMFFEKRVYQGSSGVVYPHPVIDKIYDEKHDREYVGLFLENKYLKIMLLPELGGRVQLAYDKLRRRHFVYYNQVIKPALVGLTGPWISGGIEFNWPQHHRPSTFEPVDFRLAENSDGSATVWINEVERMFGTKGLAGFTLHPDRAYLEIKAQLYNRTALPQTFLWWANPAVRVNDDYQSVFPPDVNAVFDHGKRDVSSFPIATGTYYKVDYAPGTDISRYKNIPVPTSYMAIHSDYDFVGGYEHDTQAGLLHVADHHVSPGKKQWTWGHGDFGQAWDRNLTDEDGPYIELMTGMFTDNQPDFSWLMPYEEKSFTQYFLPYQALGVVKNASKDVLVNVETTGPGATEAEVKVFVTSAQPGCRVRLLVAGQPVLDETRDLAPEHGFAQRVGLPPGTTETDWRLLIHDAQGAELLRYEPAANKQNELPQPARPALEPAAVASTEQLFLTGQHLEQYRHATYSPVPYYEEALRRDPHDARCNNALGVWHLRRGQFAKSEPYFRRAVATLTQRNPNPYDGEAYYNLGLSLKHQNRPNEAYNAFFKATWNSAWQDSAYFAVAQLDVARGHYARAVEHSNRALDRNARHGQAYVVRAAAQRLLGRPAEALATCAEALRRDAFNLGALLEQALAHRAAGRPAEAAASLTELQTLARAEAHNYLEYALDHAAMGRHAEAAELLTLALTTAAPDPLVAYHLAHFSQQTGDVEQAKAYARQGAVTPPAAFFANRLADIAALQAATDLNPTDAHAPYLLGNLWYDKRQYAEAIAAWELAAARNPAFPTAWRNLGLAYFNKHQAPEKALACYEKAFALNPTDARVLMELAQLYRRLNRPATTQLALLEAHPALVEVRDDLYLERAALYNQLGQPARAYELLLARQFHPWEGGEGKVSGEYLRSLTELAKRDLRAGQPAAALARLTQALAPASPPSLGEGKLPGAPENELHYWLGCAHAALHEPAAARAAWQQATAGRSEPAAVLFYNDAPPDQIFYQGLAWRQLGETARSEAIFTRLLTYGQQHLADEVKLDYFAVSLPDLLMFEEDLSERNALHCRYLMGLGYLGLNQLPAAEETLAAVLAQDGRHAGARVHLQLLRQSAAPFSA
jgi:tetratricopeptide (TPR) repeat protein